MAAPVEKSPITPELYLKTLESLTLKMVCVDEVNANCKRDVLNTGKTSVRLDSKTSTKQTPDEYHSYVTYRLIGFQGETVVLKIEATFCVIFGATERVPEGFSEIYNENNLPLTTMPYLRELVASLTGRMGLPMFTIPYNIFPGREAGSEQEQPPRTETAPPTAPSKKPRAKKD